MIARVVTGVYPGSFDPLTVAHLAIAEAAVRAADIDRIDLALSNVALGKERSAHSSVEARAAAIRRAARTRPWLGVAVTDAQLIADIASGYDVVVMGADKWAQVRDPQWYGGDPTARDSALAALPRVLVARRPGFEVVGAEALDVDPELAHVSSTRARSGEHHLVVPDVRVPVPAAILLLVVGLAAPVLVALYYALTLGLGPIQLAWSWVLLLAGGGVGLLCALEWGIVAGCALSVVAIAVRAARQPRAAETPVTIRGPISYAGPGSLGGTESALRR